MTTEKARPEAQPTTGYTISASPGLTTITGDAPGLTMLRAQIDQAIEAGHTATTGDQPGDGTVVVRCVKEWRPA